MSSLEAHAKSICLLILNSHLLEPTSHLLEPTSHLLEPTSQAPNSQTTLLNCPNLQEEPRWPATVKWRSTKRES